MYRTKTYIAGDWDGDQKVIEQLYKWNESNYWSLDFSDAHKLKQSRDTSLPCTIKRSLHERLEASKTFVLVVGDHTKNLTKGSCQFCDSYNHYSGYCAKGYSASLESFIEYECRYADDYDLKTVVIYDATFVDREKCPDRVRYKGTHIPAYNRFGYGSDWNYERIKNSIMNR